MATESGTIAFTWTGDNGFSATEVGPDHRRMTVAQRSTRFTAPCARGMVPRAWRSGSECRPALWDCRLPPSWG